MRPLTSPALPAGKAILAVQAVFLAVQTSSVALAGVFWIADLASFVRAYLLLAGAVLAVIGLRYPTGLHRAAALATLIAGVAPCISPVRPAATPGAQGTVITVTTANVLGTNRDPAPFFRVPEIRASDVLVLQEVNRAWYAALPEVRDSWPWQSAAVPKLSGHLVVLSRFPITGEQLITAPDPQRTGGRKMLRLTLTAGGQPLTLYAIHAETPRSPTMWRHRNNYLEDLSLALQDEAAGSRVIVAGDWNTPPWSPFLKGFLAGTGYRSSDSGFLPTPTRLPTVFGGLRWLGTPIDRLVVSPSLGLGAVSVGAGFGSDHRPVTARILLPDGT
jgi:endonuclease/exonuclease/phosphatase (EEP) superfamily protein YafD